MIEIENLRIEDVDDKWSRLVANIRFEGMKSPYAEDRIWFSVRREDREMLSENNYNPFFLVPLYLAMYHKQDLHIAGNVSKRLYKNTMSYIQKILCDFSDDLARVNITVDGFTDSSSELMGGGIVGTGISCGVDSLCTIYDHFVKEEDSEYKINTLFLFNCGTHGDFENPQTQKLYESRYEMNKKAADEMGLTVHQVNSNLHAFTHRIGEQKVGYFALWSCIFVFEKAISRYYVSSSYSYNQIKEFRKQAHDFDMAEFCESYLVPLISTETMMLVNDGSQYGRAEKTERISDWDIAQKHLNVCINSTDGSNCSKCSKCMRTLIPLEAMGKLDSFSKVFNLDVYRKNSFKNKCQFSATRNKTGFANDIAYYCKEHAHPLPCDLVAQPYFFIRRCLGKIKRILSHQH